MHPKIITALTLVLLGRGAAHAAPTNSTPARTAAQTTNQTAPTPLQQNLLTLKSKLVKRWKLKPKSNKLKSKKNTNLK